MTLPDWAPETSDVALYVTSRTVDPEGDGTEGVDFTTDTYPTVDQVTGILAGACTWVLAQVPDVSPALYELALTAAALRTAGLIQLAFPVRDGDVSNGAELLKQADGSLAALSSASGESLDALSPVGSFPVAPCPVWDLAEPRRWSW